MITENTIFRKFLIKILLTIEYSVEKEKSNELDFFSLPKRLENWEYLQRVQPDNGLITIGIGIIRLLLGIPTASEAFEFIASRSQSRICRILLVATRLRFSHYTQAYEEFQSLLGTYTDLDLPAFQVLAQAMCFATNKAGWCTFSGSGKLHLTFRRPVDPQDISVAIDGVRYPASSFKILSNNKKISITLPSEWKTFKQVHVTIQHDALLGGLFEIPLFLKTEGFVSSGPDGLSGWARYPANPEGAVKLVLKPQDHSQKPLCFFTDTIKFFAPENIAGDAIKHSFSIKKEKLALKGTVFSVCSEHEKPLYGSPLALDPFAESARQYAQEIARFFPAVSLKESDSRPALLSEKSSTKRKWPSVAIVIPVYNGFSATKNCITLCLKYKAPHARLIIVNDASPNYDILKYLYQIKNKPDVLILNNEENLGFPKSVNRGLRHRRPHEDAVLLNSDTLVCRNWLTQLQRAAYAEADIGTATPLSNNATIFSYPSATGINPIPDARACQDISAIMGRVWQGETVDVPTAHGFCMYVKSACLEQTGLLREDIFAQGYGEENDFSRRATALGWRHVACLGTFVGHAESQSFSPVKSDLIARNLHVLNGLHPGYDQLVTRWQTRDPLAPYRKKLDLARLHQSRPFLKSVILIMHDREGGILRHVWHRASLYEQAGIFAFVMVPERHRSGRPVWRLTSLRDKDYPNLTIPRNAFSFRALYKELNCEKFEIHSYIGSTIEKIFSLSELGLPYDVYIHDYSWFCPRITLVADQNHYCGEPDLQTCLSCINTFGSRTDDPAPLQKLRQWSQRILDTAEHVICPSQDAAHRITRQFTTIQADVTPWEHILNVDTLFFPPKAHHEKRIVGILGAISIEKGYDILLNLAHFINTHHIPIHLVIIGYSCDDAPLLETGVVTMTGRYQEYEIQPLTEKYAIDWFFLPSLWPETWSYVLTHIWASNRAAIVYDIGAPAERIKQAGGGLVIPLHTSLPSLIAILMAPYNYLGAFKTQGDALGDLLVRP
ncbi:glycosyltransferase [Acetobacter malorum]|uniref:glycosyltransferase n=1 Tax=Acetobacter malorum TaxID=178901 RepID=UPI0039EACEA9